MATTLNISLPLPLKKWVDEQVVAQGYSTTDAFFVEILRREKALAARERIDELLTDAISTGKPTPMTAHDWQRIRASGQKLARQRAGK